MRTYISKYANRNVTLLYVNYFESLYLPIIVRRELHKLYNLTVPKPIVNIWAHTSVEISSNQHYGMLALPLSYIVSFEKKTGNLHFSCTNLTYLGTSYNAIRLHVISYSSCVQLAYTCKYMYTHHHL